MQAVRDEAQLAGVSSFGYSGTISHVVIAAAALSASRSLSDSYASWKPPLVFKQRVLWWDGSPSHPFLHHQLQSDIDDSKVFRTPTLGALKTLIADHIVMGQIFFPGAAHLELARAASCSISSSATKRAALHAVFFVQPLVIGTENIHVECFVSSISFEVRSGAIEGAMLADATVHSKGGVGVTPEDSSDKTEYPRLRTFHGMHAMELTGLYDEFHSIGLQYGPSHRRLQQAWCLDGGEATSQLRLRQARQGTEVHPGDLDGALQLSILIMPTGGKLETRLPFAVDTAMLQGAVGQQWAVCPPGFKPNANEPQ